MTSSCVEARLSALLRDKQSRIAAADLHYLLTALAPDTPYEGIEELREVVSPVLEPLFHTEIEFHAFTDLLLDDLATRCGLCVVDRFGVPANLTMEFLAGTFSPDWKVRVRSLRDLCPCHVKRDVDPFWTRIINMRHDESVQVRRQVLHNLCDGSPAHREVEVLEAIKELHNDADEVVRRKAHKVLASYRRTGKWNIL